MIPASISGYLERNQAQYSVMSHPIAYTAQEEAAAAHVSGNAWAKAVVCFADDQPILAVLPAPCGVDLSRLQRTLHAHSIRVATEPEFAPLYQDCEVGAMPPLGPLYGQLVVVDERLTSEGDIVFNAGSHHEAIRMPYREFDRLTHPTVAKFAAPPAMLLTDPVCGAQLREDIAAGWSAHQGATYYFCSQSCKMEFDDNPFAYVRSAE
jgi:Ala-tRNA(Pro) deacylase